MAAGGRRELLAQREVAHLEVAGEVDVGEREAHVVAGRVRAARLVAELGDGPQVVLVDVERGDRARAQASAEECGELEPQQVVFRVAHEVALLAGTVALDERVRGLATQEREEREPGVRAQLPVEPALQVAERGQLRAHEPVRHEVVVGAPRRDDPGAALPREPALEHRVRIGQADGGRAGEAALARPGAVLDHEQRREPIAVER